MNQSFPLPRDPAPLPARVGIVTEILDFAQAETWIGAWDHLLAGAATPNPHFSHAVLAAHVRHGLAGPDLSVLVVRRGDRWLALVPFVRARIGWGRRVQSAFTSKFTTNGTPLLVRDELETAAAALVEALGGTGRPLWLMPSLSTASAAGAALLQACARRGLATATISAFDRAVLERRPSYEAYAAGLSANRRKGLRRQRARLEAQGALDFRTAETGQPLAEAVEAFLTLEARGWKGAGGTALASRAKTLAFARTWFAAGRGPVRPRADMLTLDGRPIAISLALVCGGTAHLVKTAYDEDLRAYGPGLLLEDEIVRACHAGFAERLDSASLAGHVLEGLYPDREPIADLLVGAGGESTDRLARIAGEERRRRAAVDDLKTLYRRLRAPRPGAASPG